MSTTIDPPAGKKSRRRKSKKKSQSASLVEPLYSGLAPSAAAMRNLCWRTTAPKQLLKLGLDLETQWREFADRRKVPRSVASLLKTKRSPLMWGTLATSLPDICSELNAAARLHRKRKPKHSGQPSKLNEALDNWLAWTGENPAPHELAFSCLQAAGILSELGSCISAKTAWSALDFLWKVATDSQTWQADADADADKTIAQQLLAVELPLTLSHLFADLAPLYGLRREARTSLAASLDELLNGNGLVRGSYLEAMRALVASWLRCRAVDAPGAKSGWNKQTSEQFQDLLVQAVRWTAPDGAPLLGANERAGWPKDFLAAIKRAGGKKLSKVASAASTAAPKNPQAAKRSAKRLPTPSHNSDWSALTVMRPRWGRNQPVLAINYAAPTAEIEVWTEGRRLLVGRWATEARIDGAVAAPVGPWEDLCWFSDRDVDYLELRQALSDGATLERQILLARRDRILWMCEHLRTAAVPAQLELSWQIPLDAESEFAAEAETRDALLVSGKRTYRMLPLALSEWRVDPRLGEFATVDGRLTLARRDYASVVASPLLIDLDPKRSRRQCTWRQLTVGEGLKIQEAGAAVAYRAQLGDDQWLFYRSQGPRGNRTFMGQNTSSEFVAAKFVAETGEIEELLEIEG